MQWGTLFKNVKVTAFSVLWLVFNRTLSIYEYALLQPSKVANLYKGWVRGTSSRDTELSKSSYPNKNTLENGGL